MSLDLRTGDAARAAIVLGAATLVAAGNDVDGLALGLVAPAAWAVRLLPAEEALDAILCTALLCAQLGAVAGLTETTAWWDSTAHVVTGALVAGLLARVLPSHAQVGAIAGVALLAGGWELFEWGVDRTAATDFSPSAADTVMDLALGLAGAVGAVLCLIGRESLGHWRVGRLGQTR